MMTRLNARRTLEASAGLVILAGIGLAGCKHPASGTPALKATAAGTALVESSGGHQVGATGTVLKDPVVVQVNDDQAAAVPGALVEFHGSAGVSFDPAAAITDSSGQATTLVALGSIAGRYELSATTPGKSKPVTLNIVETALGYQQRVGSILADKYCNRCHDPESSAERVSNHDNLEVKPHAFSEGDTLNKMTAADVRALIAYTRAVADPPYQPAGTVYARK